MFQKRQVKQSKPKKRSIFSAQASKASLKSKSKGSPFAHVPKPRVEVQFDDPAVVAALALQPLNEQELAARQVAMRQLRQDVIADEDLPLREMLDETCQLVLWRGNLASNLMIVGEAPGGEEAKSGQPFVGPSGQLLSKMLKEQGILSQEHAFITNLVYIRPSTGNRDPNWEEVNAYLPYLKRMIGIVRPKVVLCMGRLSSALFGKGLSAINLLKGTMNENGSHKLIGENFESLYRDRLNETSITLAEQRVIVRVYCSYHPAYILRQQKQLPDELKYTDRWKADFKRVRALLEEPTFEYIDVEETVRSTTEPGFVFANPNDVRYRLENRLSHEAQLQYAEQGLEFEVHKVDYERSNIYRIVGRTIDDHSVCLIVRRPMTTFYVSHHCIKTGVVKQEDLERMQHEVRAALLLRLSETQRYAQLEGTLVQLSLKEKLKAIDISRPKPMLAVSLQDNGHKYHVAAILDEMFNTIYKDPRPPKPHKRYFPKGLTAIKTYESRFTEIQHLMLDKNIYIRGWLQLPSQRTSSLKLIPPSSRCSTAELEYEVDFSELKGYSPNPDEAGNPYWERQAPTRLLALDAEMLGQGGKFPRYEQDPVISIAAYSNTADRPNKKNYIEKVRVSAAGKSHEIRSTGRTNYDDAAIFCLGSLASVETGDFKPTCLPNVSHAPKNFSLGWNEGGRKGADAYKTPYAISIRTWNSFIENFHTWVELVGLHRAKRVVNDDELFTRLRSMQVRPGGKDVKSEWKDEQQILKWESDVCWIAKRFPERVKKKDIANLKCTKNWLENIEQLSQEDAEAEYGTAQARWKHYRPNSSVFSFSTERDMFRGFYKYIESYDPDIITGYNSNNFDLSYFINRVRVLDLIKEDGSSFISMGRYKAESDRDELKQSFSKATGERSYHVPRLKGRDAYDLMNYVMRDMKLKSYGLASVSQECLKDTKNDVPYSAIPSLFRTNRKRLNAYCGKDAELVLMLINDMNNMNYLIALARLIGLMHIERLYVDGKQEQVFSVLMRWFRDEGCNKVMPDRNKYSKEEDGGGESFEGAHVFEPKTKGLYEKLLLCLDYNSLYPTIMLANNLGHDKAGTAARMAKYGYKLEDCFQTLRTFVNPKTNLPEHYYFLKPRKLLEEEAVAQGLDPRRDCTLVPGKEAFWIFEDAKKVRYRCNAKAILEKGLNIADAVFSKPQVRDLYTPKNDVASICSALTKMLAARKRVNIKKELFHPSSDEYRRLNQIQMALKIVCNSTYGATGVKVGKLAGMHISATVTGFGKNTILRLADEMAKQFDGDVQGGDTDSIFVHFPSIPTLDKIYEKIQVTDPETGEIRTMSRIQQILEVANSLVPAPMKIDFEKAFEAFFGFAKKRAVTLTQMPIWDPLRMENVFREHKLAYKGVEMVRRDSCKAAQTILTGFAERVFGLVEGEGGNKEEREMYAVQFAKREIEKIDNGELKFHELIQSRQLSKKHYNTEVPHAVLNEKMRRRGMRPKELGERINFVVVTGRADRSFAQSVEDPDYCLKENLLPSTEYIIDKKVGPGLMRFTQFMPRGEEYDKIMFGGRVKRQRENILEDDPVFRMVTRSIPCMQCGLPSPRLVCDACKPTADWRKLLDDENSHLQSEEAEYEKAMKVCRTCTGVGVDEPVDCDNGTCPSYYPRRGGEFSIARRKVKIDTLQNYVNW